MYNICILFHGCEEIFHDLGLEQAESGSAALDFDEKVGGQIISYPESTTGFGKELSLKFRSSAADIQVCKDELEP